MFIIADVRHKNPSYFWKNVPSASLISMEIKQAKIFNSFKEARMFLEIEIIKDDLFVFSICELGIIKSWD